MSDRVFLKLYNFYKNSLFTEFEKEFFEKKKENLLCEKCYNLFGIYLQKQQKFKESIEYFNLAILTNSLFTEAKVNKAYIQINHTKEIEKAQKLLLEVLAIDKKNKNANFLLAEIYFIKQQYEDCIKICEIIVSRDPLISANYHRLGIAYSKINNFEKAILNFKKSIQLDPNNYTAHLNLHEATKSIKDFAESEKILKRLIKTYPNDKRAYLRLSNFYRGIGKFSESDHILEDLIERLGFEDFNAVYELLSSPKYIRQEQLSLSVENKFHEQTKEFQERVGYGLFKFYDRKKNFDKASSFLKKSLNLTQARLNYNFDYEKKQFQFLKNTFDKNFFTNINNASDANNKFSSIFIVGLHRSGSTLLEQILSTNKHFASLGETEFFPNLISNYYPDQQLDRFNLNILNTKKQQFAKIGEHYLKAINSGTKISIDKQLANFKLAGFIFACLPNALIVHIKRDRNDNLFSILSNYYFDDHAPWSYETSILSKYYDEYVSLMAHWNNFCSHKIVNIEYEKLVYEPKKEILKILEKLNIEWNESFLNFQSNKNIVETQSVFQVREDLYTTSVGRWKSYKDYFPNFFK